MSFPTQPEALDLHPSFSRPGCLHSNIFTPVPPEFSYIPSLRTIRSQIHGSQYQNNQIAFSFVQPSRPVPSARCLDITVILRNCFCYDVMYLLSAWSRVLLEKLIGFQLVKKFPAFYGTRRFITVFTSVRHLSLSCASLIQSIPHILFPEDPP